MIPGVRNGNGNVNGLKKVPRIRNENVKGLERCPEYGIGCC
jgi:hypothetical protein